MKDEELPSEPADNLDLGDTFADNSFDLYGGDLGIGAEPPISKYSDLIKELTNFAPQIARRIRNWLGLEYDEDTKGYIQKRDAIINVKGAKWAVGFLETYQTRTNIITNISQYEFKNLQLDIIKVVWLVFPTIDEFNVKQTADWYRLCTELEHSAFLVLAGAGDGKYTKFLGEAVTRTETVQLTPQQANVPVQTPGIVEQIKNKLIGKK